MEVYILKVSQFYNNNIKTLGSIKNIHLYLNFVFFGFKIAVFFRFNL